MIIRCVFSRTSTAIEQPCVKSARRSSAKAPPAARQRANELSKRLNRRPLSECQAAEVISAVVGMLESLEAENRLLRDENQSPRTENELFSRSILRLQCRINAE